MIFHLDARRDRFVQAHPQLVPCRAGSGPRHLALHPKLKVLYCVNELAGTLAAFAIQNETGALRAMQYEDDDARRLHRQCARGRPAHHP